MLSSLIQIGLKKAFKYVQNQIFKTDKEEQDLSLENIRMQTRTLERNIPIVFGEVLLAGNIIWMSDIKKVSHGEVTIMPTLLANIIHFSQFNTLSNARIEYSIDLIIAICEGEVDDILGVYINGASIDVLSYNFRFYKGSNAQEPDPLILKEKLDSSPAFRGLCYAVFEDFNLSDFGNTIPKFEFFIKRSNFGRLNSKVMRLKNSIKGVNLMPGSGEFVYEPSINAVYQGIFINPQTLKPSGKITHSNNNTNKKQADAIVALNQLKEDLPNLEWVSLVVTWFADGTQIASTSIFPAVEFNDKKSASYPIKWQVAGKERWEVRQVSRRSDGSLNYGGTVSDFSIINILKELRDRGYKIVFYPMIFVDTEDKPWRGRMTGEAKDVAGFFTKKEGYNNFILHYANLVHNLCDVFIIGSEMKGLTQIKDNSDKFPAVLEFAKLAKVIKGRYPNLKLTYASDWSEYHSFNGFYNMDDLWSSPYIDFIGIDAYFPLTHTVNKPSIEEVKRGWQSGEGWDFYLEDEEMIKYQSPNFAWKNLRWFLSNEHINIDGSKTAFKPYSKKIWFTEFGFPSLDLCSNQPNVFFDPTSKESFLPKFSSGIVDFEAQKDALLATLEFLEESKDIIENAFVWCYDLRPYPFFPQRKDVWSDGDLWQRGHWLNGKLGANTFNEIVRELCVRSGVLEEELEFECTDERVEGMCINNAFPFGKYIDILCDVFSVKLVQSSKGLKFSSIQVANKQKVKSKSLIKIKKSGVGGYDEEASLAGLPSSISFSFIDKFNKYEPTIINFNYGSEVSYFDESIRISAPIILNKERALEIAKNILQIKRAESFERVICIPFGEGEFEAGEIVETEEGELFIEEVKVDENLNVFLKGINVPKINLFTGFKEEQNDLLLNNLEEDFEAFCLQIPKNLQEYNSFKIFANKSGGRIFFENQLLGEIRQKRVIGKVINGSLNDKVSAFFKDKTSYLEVLIENEEEGKKIKSGCNNMAIVGQEICIFQNINFQGDGIFRIEGFLRKRSKVNHKLGNDIFILLNMEDCIYLPYYKTNGKFLIEKFELLFSVESNSKQIYIARKGVKFLKDGTLLYWIFGELDFPEFEKEYYRNILIELEIDGEIIKTFGDNYFAKNKFITDFKVNLIS
jgi:hypothetical protein